MAANHPMCCYLDSWGAQEIDFPQSTCARKRSVAALTCSSEAKESQHTQRQPETRLYLPNTSLVSSTRSMNKNYSWVLPAGLGVSRRQTQQCHSTLGNPATRGLAPSGVWPEHRIQSTDISYGAHSLWVRKGKQVSGHGTIH